MLEQIALLSHWPLLGQLGLIAGIVFISAYLGFKLVLWSSLLFAATVLIGLPMPYLAILGGGLLLLNVRPIRKLVLSNPIMKVLQALKIMPAISETEKVALEAGTTWVEGDLFSGSPDFNNILNQKAYKLTAEEEAFIAGPVKKLCDMVDDWEVFKLGDLPPQVWDFIKKEKFLGMIVPKKYGGLEFSASCHSLVISQLSSRCIPVGITVMVPNSLGPAELIAHYGTQAQKDYYLPRLAVGDEVPCFGLTEPDAGSDASSISSNAVVFKGEDGKLYLKINWDKRYITLAAISTVIGLAVQLRDPENLLGKGENIGITCVLVPAKTKGVVLGKRHNPMGVPFYNCPTQGKDVIVSIDQIIGGANGAGMGWRMLMESLAAGRSISLPALSAALTKVTSRVCSAYSVVRKQFGVPIGKFEGIEEKLARVLGLTYMTEAVRSYTCGAVDQGIKPSVVSAIAKYQTTEISRTCINDAMDIVGGAGISRGPQNRLAHAYMATPIGITVEGANILTRTMIIFGQGALRCHPFAYLEFKSVVENDLETFDKAFWGHIGFVAKNKVRATLLTLTRGRLASVPRSKMKRYYQKLSWSSASFAFLADIAMAAYGGSLKQKEAITGKYADILMWMYFIAATLKSYKDEGEPDSHDYALKWSLNYAFTEIQKAFDGILSNISMPVFGWIFRGPIAFWSRLNRLTPPPSDALSHKLVNQFLKPSEFRDWMTQGIYEPHLESDPQSILEKAFVLAVSSDDIFKKITKAVKEGKLPKDRPHRLINIAQEKGVISQEEKVTLEKAQSYRNKAVAVDAFDVLGYQNGLLEFQKTKQTA